MTTIEWTDETWNPTLGCDRVSPGCDGCYAIRSSRVRSGNPHPAIAGAHAGLTERRDGRLDWTGQVNLLPERLDQPLRWRTPRRVFVDSMSDLFHDDVPTDFIVQVLAVIARTPQHTYQVLTKRHARMRAVLSALATHQAVAAAVHGPMGAVYPEVSMPWPLRNLWVGVSVEDQKRADLRVPALLETPAAVRFLSCEPLLGPLDIHRWMTYECSRCYRRGPWTDGVHADDVAEDEYWCQTCGEENQVSAIAGPKLHWVIVGGESGPGSRPMPVAWARALRGQCERARVPFFFKQWGDWVSTSPPGPLEEPTVWVSHADGRTADEATALAAGGSWTGVHRVGKKVAGRVLDSRTHDDFPPAIAS